MTKPVNLIHVGLGLIGGAALDILRQQRERWLSEFGLEIRFRSFIDTSGGVACDEEGGYSDRTIDRLLAARAEGRKVVSAAPEIGLRPRNAGNALSVALSMGPAIMIDCASGQHTAGLSARVVKAGNGAVFSNKAPLALPASASESQTLWPETKRNGLVRYETTCGAGLPVLSTLRTLLDSGDEVLGITGSLSGTLGAIFADVASGSSFGRAVRSAKERGYTEPDPRDDLSGLDVARKALILARTIGMQADLEDVTVESLVPDELREVAVPEFLERISAMDGDVARRAAQAAASGSALKYVATVSPADGVKVGMQAASRDTVLGSLQGPENVIAVRTRRYDAFPLTISGPGAGAQVTAAGVVADVLSLATRIGE